MLQAVTRNGEKQGTESFSRPLGEDMILLGVSLAASTVLLNLVIAGTL